MDSVNVDRVLLCRVSPFGYLRIKAHLRLPEAFRSLSRPSSALSAKAFPLRPLQLDLVLVGFLNVLKLDLSHLFPPYFLTLLGNTQSITLVGFVVCRKYLSRSLRSSPFRNPPRCFFNTAVLYCKN